VSRQWPGKTLADHRADNRAWIRAALAESEHPEQPETTGERYRFELARPEDPDVLPLENRILRAVSARIRRRSQLNALSATVPTARAAWPRPRDMRRNGMGEELLTADEVAARLRATPRFVRRLDAGALVFAGGRGTSLRTGNFRRAVGWSKVLADAGMPAGTRELMRRIRHAGMRTALIYQHATSGEVAESMDGRIAKGGKTGKGKKQR
jgi:hypothetical protein